MSVSENQVRINTSRVDISYGNGDVSTRMEFAGTQTSADSNYTTLYNQRHVPDTAAMTLEGGEWSQSERFEELAEQKRKGTLFGVDLAMYDILETFTLGRRRGLADPQVVGWWSSSPSSLTVTENGGYDFNVPPTLTVTFLNRRPVKGLEIFADPKLQEYPTKFTVTITRETDGDTDTERELYGKYDTSYPNASVTQTTVSRTFYYGADSDMATDFGGTLSFLDPKLHKELYERNNGYITDVRKIELKIFEWNKPGRYSKVYRFFDDIVESYAHDELQSVEVVYESSNSGNIEYGLVSGSCSVTLLNKGRKFDLGYLSEMVHTNRRVVPYINNVRLGTFFIKEWDVPQDGLFVNCKANDRLLDYQNIKFCGLMPNPNNVQKMSFYELFEFVLNYANDKYASNNANATRTEFIIDGRLKNASVKVEPYLPRESVWNVLQRLCEASLSFVYVDRNDRINVVSELFAEESASDGENAAYNARIDKHNAFSVKVPFMADMTANSVEIPYYYKEVKENEELCKIEGVTVAAGQTVTVKYELNDFGEITEVYCGEQELTLMNDTSTDSFRRLTGALTLGSDYNITNGTITVQGKKTSFKKQVCNLLRKESIKKNGLSLYTHPDCELIQSKALAEMIGDRVLARYVAGTKSAECNWTGEADLQLFDEYLLSDRFDQKGEYQATYVKSTMNGGFRQEVKGILRKKL